MKAITKPDPRQARLRRLAAKHDLALRKYRGSWYLVDLYRNVLVAPELDDLDEVEHWLKAGS
jgi:hypothetical protein